MELKHSDKGKEFYPTLLNSSISNNADNSSLLRLTKLNKSNTIAQDSPSNVQNFSSTPKLKLFQNSSILAFKYNSRLSAAVKVLNNKNIHDIDVLKFPISAEEVPEKFPNLPDWVLEELKSFKEVFYMSRRVKPQKKQYENEMGDYNITIGDDIYYRYEIQDTLGKGTFGQVVKAFDHVEKKQVALKIIKNKQRYISQARTEVEILKRLGNDSYSKDCIVEYISHFYFRNRMVNFM